MKRTLKRGSKGLEIVKRETNVSSIDPRTSHAARRAAGPVGQAPSEGSPAGVVSADGCGTLAAGWSASVGLAGEGSGEGSKASSWGLALQTSVDTADTD